eukprot:2202270-Prymnesium_polylepis.1
MADTHPDCCLDLVASDAFAKMSHLESLQLFQNSLADSTGLVDSLKRSSIRHLYAGGNHGPKFVRPLAAGLPHIPTLQTLDLRNIAIADEAFSALVAALKESSVTRLCLQRCHLSTAALGALAAALKDSKMVDLAVGFQHWSTAHESLEAFGAALPSTLRHLSLCACGFTLSSAPERNFCKCLSKTSITSLDLHDNEINNDGAQSLASNLPSHLTRLHLGFNQIGSAGARALANILPGTQLAVLVLRNNELGSVGVQAFAEVLRDSRLTHLNIIEGNGIDPERDADISLALRDAARWRCTLDDLSTLSGF